MKTYFQLETKCSGWSCREEKFQLSPFIVVCYSWTVEYNWDKFTKRLRLLAGLLIFWWAPSWGAPSAVACQDNLLNLLFSSLHLPFQYCHLWPVSLDKAAAVDRSPCGALSRPGDSGNPRHVCSGCVFSRVCPSVSLGCGVTPMAAPAPAVLCDGCYSLKMCSTGVSQAEAAVGVKADFWPGGTCNSRNPQFAWVCHSRGICKLD